MMSSVICMSSKRNPDCESDTDCNKLILSGRFCEVVQINLLSEFR